MIAVENLTKRFREVAAVEGLTFKVEEGEVFGFLGSNGAGKTTIRAAVEAVGAISSLFLLLVPLRRRYAIE
jgi:ABC-2 type transport system ATP-binding protein